MGERSENPSLRIRKVVPYLWQGGLRFALSFVARPNS